MRERPAGSKKRWTGKRARFSVSRNGLLLCRNRLLLRIIGAPAPVYACTCQNTPGGLRENALEECASQGMSEGIVPGNAHLAVQPRPVAQYRQQFQSRNEY